MKAALRVILAVLLLCQSATPQIITIAKKKAGGTPPSSFSGAGGSVSFGGGSTFTLSTLSISAGEAVTLAFAAQGTSDLCSTITGVTAAGGSDTFVQGPAVVNGGVFKVCLSFWTIFNPTPSGTYTIVLQGGGGSPAAFAYTIEHFTKGTVAGTADGTCTNTSNGATSLQCSAAISPSGTIEACIGASGAYDNLSGSEADNSSPAMTIPSGGANQGSGVASVVMTYYIGNPPAGSVTPGIQNAGIGDPLTVIGACFK